MSTIEERQAHRARVAPGVAVGVTEAMICELVHAFYGRVRQDPELGPVFERAIDDWDEHLAKLCDFWSSVILMTGRFSGSPMAAHARRDDIAPEHFARWLELFAETARAVSPPDAAALFIARSQAIGRRLQLGLGISRREPPPP